MDKSFVSMERKICMITGKVYETNSLILDKRMRDRFDQYTTTGFGICPEAQENIDKGFCAFVAIDHDKSELNENGTYSPEGVYRTGAVAFVKYEAAKEMFDVKVNRVMNYCDEEVIIALIAERDRVNNQLNS